MWGGAGTHQLASVAYDQHAHACVVEKGAHNHVVNPIQYGLPHIQIEVVLDLCSVALPLVPLRRERVDRAEAREDLLRDVVGAGEAVLDPLGVLAKVPPVNTIAQGHEGHDRAHNRGELGVGVEERQGNAEDAHHRLD